LTCQLAASSHADRRLLPPDPDLPEDVAVGDMTQAFMMKYVYLRFHGLQPRTVVDTVLHQSANDSFLLNFGHLRDDGIDISRGFELFDSRRRAHIFQRGGADLSTALDNELITGLRH
jgi:hypothetical protein